MKTIIEVEGHEIVIDVAEESVSVSAVRKGEEEEEVVEEFTLELGESEDFEDLEDGEGDDIKGFGDFEEEGDFDELEGEEDLEAIEGGDLEGAEVEEDDFDETKLESYESFLEKMNK